MPKKVYAREICPKNICPGNMAKLYMSERHATFDNAGGVDVRELYPRRMSEHIVPEIYVKNDNAR